MILLVPTSPEVPKHHEPRLWPALVLVLFLGITYIEVYPALQADTAYVENLQTFVVSGADGNMKLRPEAHNYLKLRPLLKFAPSKGDWDLRRLLLANFIHGGFVHLALNLIGVFAGMRICSTFMPFLCAFSIFLFGGSLGLLVSLVASSEMSAYIPHVGASGGIFALMGAYYIYNFRYRTRYFFWFPSKQGLVNLRTSWFFFVDVALMEIVLSTSQLFPNRVDSVDHIAHVIGFSSGAILAYMLRFLQRWPSFLQSRGEFIYWTKLVRPKVFDPVFTPFDIWLELLELNSYNDLVKLKVFKLIYYNSEVISDEQIAKVFKFLSPTFIRLHSQEVGVVLQELLAKNRTLPKNWLVSTPYDSVIRLAKVMASPPEDQVLLYKFVAEYRRAHPEGGNIDRKLELLMRKLSGLMPNIDSLSAERRAGFETSAGTQSNEVSGSFRRQKAAGFPPERARRGSR